MVGRPSDSRRAGRDLRRRWHAVDAAERDHRARVVRQRQELQHRRRDSELAGRRRRLDDALLRPGNVRRGQLHDFRHPGGNHGRRRRHQHGDEGRRQRLARTDAVQLLERQPAVGEPPRRGGSGRARRQHVPRQPDDQDVRLQHVGRRRDRQEPVLGQRHGPQMGRQQARERQEPGRHAGARRQRPEELLRQGDLLAVAEPEGRRLVSVEQQDSRPSPRHAAQQRARHRRDRADQSRLDDAGEVHRRARADGLRVELQRDGRSNQLRLRAQHAARRDPQGGQHAVDGRERGRARRASAQLAPPMGQRAELRRKRPGRRPSVQGGRAVGADVLRVRVHGAGPPLRRVLERRTDAGPRVQHADRREEPRPRARILRAGFLVRRPAHAEPRHAVRPLPRDPAGAVEPGRTIHRGAQHPARRADQPGYRRVAHRRRLRSDGRRQDGAQGELQSVRTPDRHRPRHERQPAGKWIAHLPVERCERRWQVPSVRDHGTMLGVQRRRRHLLRSERRRLAVLG